MLYNNKNLNRKYKLYYIKIFKQIEFLPESLVTELQTLQECKL